MSTLATLVVRLVGDVGGFGKAMGIAEKTADSAGKKIQNALGGGIAAVGKMALGVGVAGIGAFVGMIGKGIADGIEAENVMTQLHAVIKSTGGVAGVSADEIRGLAEGLEKTTKFSAESTIAASSLLLTFTSIGRDVFPMATKTVLNMAQALGQDTKSASLLLGKALNDPILGIGALRKVGVQLSAAQEKQVKSFMAVNNIAAAQKVILGELETQFGGSAEAAGKTLSGQMEIAKNALGAVGEVMAGALLPIITDLATKFTTFLTSNEVATFAGNVSKGFGIISDLINGLVSGGDPFGVITNSLFKFFTALGMGGSDAAKLAVGIASLVDAIAKGDWGAIVEMAKGWAGALLNWVQTDVIPFIGEKFTELVTKIGEWITTNAPVIVEKVKEWGAAVLGFLATEVIPLMPTKIAELAVKIGEWITTNAPTIVEKVKEWANVFLNWAQTDVIPLIGAKVTEIAGKIRAWVETEAPIIATKLKEWGAAFLSWVDTDVLPVIATKLEPIWTEISGWAVLTGARIKAQVDVWAQQFSWWVSTAVTNLPTELAKFWDALYTWVNDTAKKLIDKQEVLAKALVDWINTDAIPWLKTEFPKFVTVLAALIIGIPLAIAAVLVTTALVIIQGLVDAMKTAITNEATRITKIAIAIIDGLIKGFNDAKQQVIDALLKILEGAVNAVKAFFGISSPSKLMAGIGFNIAAGMARGIMGGSGLVDSAMGALAGAVVPSSVSVGGGIGRRGEGEKGSSAGGGMPMQAVVNVHLDGRLVESFVTDMLYTSLQGAA